MESLTVKPEVKKAFKHYLKGTIFSKWLCDDILTLLSTITLCHDCLFIKDKISSDETCNNCQQNGIPIHTGNVPFIIKKSGKYLIAEDIVWKGPGPMISACDGSWDITIIGKHCIYSNDVVFMFENLRGILYFGHVTIHKIPTFEETAKKPMVYSKVPKKIKYPKNIAKPYNKRPKW